MKIATPLPKNHEKDWAFGCADCKFGIVLAPDIVPTLPLHEGRAVQAGEEMILFCNCRAGHMYRQHLRRVYGAMTMQSKQHLREYVLAANTPPLHAATATPQGEPVHAAPGQREVAAL